MGAAVALLILGSEAMAADGPANGRAAPCGAGAAGDSGDAVQEVVVAGLRASIKDSLDIKQKSVGAVEVVSAEDIGKLPDKNVADALQRLPGVNVSSAAVGEGGFGERCWPPAARPNRERVRAALWTSPTAAGAVGATGLSSAPTWATLRGGGREAGRGGADWEQCAYP